VADDGRILNHVDATAFRDRTAGLFIDADNVDAEVIEHALAAIHERGLRTTIRRAYGGHDRLLVLKDVCVAHAVKLLPNHGKGTTDASLVVDVMDLLHGSGFPAVVAVASADADFAALAIRLREAGCFTLCFANPEKADADALGRAYDEVIYVGARRERAAPLKAAARRAAAPRKSAPAAAPAAEAPLARLKEVLSLVPGLREGKAVELNEVVALLRREQLLGRTGSGPRFLAKNAPYLRLTPDKQPNKVHWPSRTN
jgi:hypothetical protein